MSRLLFVYLIVGSFVLGGCNVIGSEISVKQKEVDSHNEGVLNTIDSYKKLEYDLDDTSEFHEDLVKKDTYKGIDIVSNYSYTHYIDNYITYIKSMDIKAIDKESNTLLHLLRINGVDSHMYIKIYWDLDTREIIEIHRGVVIESE